MTIIQKLTQVSAKLYQHLSDVPSGEARDEYIKVINDLLDERGNVIAQLRKEQFEIDSQQKAHLTLVELDKGIRERLEKVMLTIKTDMKDLQNAKKNEQQYMNPYENLRNLDGMYYDKKK